MTMYLMLFRQGQSAVSAILSSIGGMYEDNLYLSTLYEYLETPVRANAGSALRGPDPSDGIRSEEHTSELQSLMRISYAVFCLKKKTTKKNNTVTHTLYKTKPH